jgi:hypothetical protein
VSERGELVYSFDDDFHRVLLQRSAVQRVRDVFDRVYPVAFYALRVCFGLTLLTSLAVLSTVFVAVTSAQSSSSDDDNHNRGRRNNMNSGGSFTARFTMNLFSDFLFEFLFYRDYYGFYGRQARGEGRRGQLSFVESFFSYVFGDGDPNEGFLERQTVELARVIRGKDGVVAAEELAPFLDPPTTPPSALPDAEVAGSGLDTTSIVVDESWVLPAVLRLGGQPMVTGRGDILYSFPELTTTAMESTDTGTGTDNDTKKGPAKGSLANLFGSGNGNGSSRGERPELSLEEERTPFSVARPDQLAVAAGLGGLNLAGCLWLGRLVSQVEFAALNPSLWLVLSRLQPFLLAYALLYNIIPAARSLVNTRRNAGVDERNGRRRQWRSVLASPDTHLRAKLAAATELASDSPHGRIGAGRSQVVVYSTSDDADTQLREEASICQFDDRLRRTGDDRCGGGSGGSGVGGGVGVGGGNCGGGGGSGGRGSGVATP